MSDTSQLWQDKYGSFWDTEEEAKLASAAPLREAAPPRTDVKGECCEYSEGWCAKHDPERPLEEAGEPATDLRASVNDLLQYVDTNDGKNGAEACINRVLAAVQFAEADSSLLDFLEAHNAEIRIDDQDTIWPNSSGTFDTIDGNLLSLRDAILAMRPIFDGSSDA